MMKFILTTFVAVLAIAGTMFGYTKLMTEKNAICSQEYALCTSAQCVPDPNQPDRAICFCEVHDGKSLGHTSCENRMPNTNHLGVKQVISTFSFDDFPNKKVMTCPSGKPWTNCLDQPCTVDPLDPSKAICSCKIVRSGAFQTLGGHCKQSTCDSGFWSGATIEDVSENQKALMQALGMKQPPARYCSK